MVHSLVTTQCIALQWSVVEITHTVSASTLDGFPTTMWRTGSLHAMIRPYCRMQEEGGNKVVIQRVVNVFMHCSFLTVFLVTHIEPSYSVYKTNFLALKNIKK